MDVFSGGPEKHERGNRIVHKVLVVDDHPFIQRFYGIALNGLPVRSYYAGDGREAVRVAKEVKPDLIFMDYRLPLMDGEEATLAIRQIPELRKTIIVALTAETRSKAESLKGFDSYLLKPVRVEAVVDLLARYLGIAPLAKAPVTPQAAS